MSFFIVAVALYVAQAALGVALVLSCWRTIQGPRAQDRVLALDTLYVTAMLLMLVVGMREGSPFFFEAAFVIAVLGFITTVSLAKFLMRGEIIE